MRAFNPDTVVQPASKYAQGVVHNIASERLIISGQIGVRVDGSLVEGLEAQMEQAWSNVFAVMADAGFERECLARATVYVTVPGQVGLFREVRERLLAGHLCASTYLEVSGLAAPELLVEIEAEAVR